MVKDEKERCSRLLKYRIKRDRLYCNHIPVWAFEFHSAVNAGDAILVMGNWELKRALVFKRIRKPRHMYPCMTCCVAVKYLRNTAKPLGVRSNCSKWLSYSFGSEARLEARG